MLYLNAAFSFLFWCLTHKTPEFIWVGCRCLQAQLLTSSLLLATWMHEKRISNLSQRAQCQDAGSHRLLLLWRCSQDAPNPQHPPKAEMCRMFPSQRGKLWWWETSLDTFKLWIQPFNPYSPNSFCTYCVQKYKHISKQSGSFICCWWWDMEALFILEQKKKQEFLPAKLNLI